MPDAAQSDKTVQDDALAPAQAVPPAAPPWEPNGKQVAFLASYAITCSITGAVAAAGIARSTHYEWMKASDDYRALFAEARLMAFDILEEAAVTRARDGVEEPIFHDGKQVGTVRKYSDRLMEVLLKGNKPDVYRDRSSVEHTGKDGTPLLNLAMMDKILAEGRGDTDE